MYYSNTCIPLRLLLREQGISYKPEIDFLFPAMATPFLYLTRSDKVVLVK